MGDKVITDGAVYFVKDDVRTLHSRQFTVEQSKTRALKANADLAALGMSGTYIATEEHFEREAGV